jgi:uncharacterized membrane protein
MASGDTQQAWPRQLQPHVFYGAVVILGLIGLALASYLSYLDYSKADVTSCAPGSGCDTVRDSRYANVLSVPVAVWGIVGYLLIIVTALVPYAEQFKRLALFVLTCAGLAFSAYLTYLELFVIRAICPYCMGSAGTMAILFVLVVSQRPVVPNVGWRRLAVLGMGLLVLVVLLGVFLPHRVGTSENERLERFQVGLAQHLKSIGAVMYSSSSCQFCYLQKAEFGEAFQYIDIINCDGPPEVSPQPGLCVQKGITEAPTWEINGRMYQGLKTLEQLADLSEYKEPR